MSDSENLSDSRSDEYEENGNDMEINSELDPTERAEQWKEEGNSCYKEKRYSEALQCYTAAINLCPTCASYYGNRSATFIMLNKHKEALEDARQAVLLDNTFLKGYLREGKCHLALGQAPAAIRSYQHVLALEPENAVALSEIKTAQNLQECEDKAESCFSKGDYRTMLFCIDRCLDCSPNCVKYKILKAECLALLGRYQSSQEIANGVLLFDNLNADAIYVRGMCLYYEDNADKAYSHFQQVLRLAPDHVKAKAIYKKARGLAQKKEEGNKAFRNGQLQDAYNIYSEALTIDPNNKFTNSKLYFNRATVLSKLNQLEQSIEDCTKAVELDDTYLKAYLRRAKCRMDLEQYEEAVRDYENICKMDRSQENKRLLQEAKLELKKSKRKDYYKILGVGKTATDDEIKKAYKKRALIHHPDRHSHATPEVQKEEEKKFKELGEAYGVLSDPKKKARYDSGQDLEDLEHGGFDIDPNQIFQAFFGGSQGASPFGGQGFPGGFHSGGGGFPGSGFSFHFG